MEIKTTEEIELKRSELEISEKKKVYSFCFESEIYGLVKLDSLLFSFRS